MFDTNAYLERIAYSGDRTPTIATLRALHAAHLQAVPFENLDIRRGTPISLAPDALFDKIVLRRRGGFCYELNGLFAQLLEQFGYQVTLLAAGVHSRGRFGPIFDHLALVVTIDDVRWLADVGFGDSFREPLRFDTSEEQHEGERRFRLEHEEAHVTLHELGADAVWTPQYRLSRAPRQIPDFLGMCHYQQVSPATPFTRRSICSRTTPDGRVTLSDRTLIVTTATGRDERRLEDEAAWTAALRKHFSIELALPPDPAQEAPAELQRHAIPILEFDPSRRAVINPNHRSDPVDLPEHMVFCFFREVIERLVRDHGAQQIAAAQTEIGEHPIYRVAIGDRHIAVMHPGLGAAMAAILFEASIGRGARTFMACGGGGVLDPRITVGHLVVPALAVRDEGTSYHYLPPAREVAAHPEALAALAETLEAHNMPYIVSKCWTTDGLFRETPAKVRRRRDEGCLMVEMEAAAFFAIAQFRGVRFGQLLYGGDDVSAPEWDHRGWLDHHSTREKMFWLAAEACLRMS